MNRAARRKEAHIRKTRETALRHLRLDREEFKGLTLEETAKFLLNAAYAAYKKGWLSKTEARMFGCRGL